MTAPTNIKRFLASHRVPKPTKFLHSSPCSICSKLPELQCFIDDRTGHICLHRFMPVDKLRLLKITHPHVWSLINVHTSNYCDTHSKCSISGLTGTLWGQMQFYVMSIVKKFAKISASLSPEIGLPISIFFYSKMYFLDIFSRYCVIA